MEDKNQELIVPLSSGQKAYFASDFHLGAPNPEKSRERENKIIRWLQHVSKDAAAIFLVGDLFDFWFEYQTVIPKGFVRFQGELARLTDKGIPVYIVAGNHDLWMKNYLPEELGVRLIRNGTSIKVGPKSIYLAHGDALGKAPGKYKITKSIFTNPLLQWAYRWIHPDWGVKMAKFFSNNSREKALETSHENAILIAHSRQVEKEVHHDYYIFGHVHVAMDESISEKSRYINLGEWFDQCTYLEINENSAELLRFTD